MSEQISAELEQPAVVVDRDGGGTGLVVTGWAVDREFETIRFEQTPMIPDTRWVGTGDDHEHTWEVPDAGPAVVTGATRVMRHVPCDGSCGGVCGGEGYHVPVWVCDTTGDDLDPGYVPDPRGREWQILRSETFTIDVQAVNGLVPPVIESGRVEWDGGRMDLPEVMRQTGDVTFGGNDPVTTQYVGNLPHRGDDG